MTIPIIDTIIKAGEKIADKIWMDKEAKEKLEFTKEQFISQINFNLNKLEQEGELKKIEGVFKESQAQRDYANNQFGTAAILKNFGIGQAILLGRASIRWIITGFAMWQCHRIVTFILTNDVIEGLGKGTMGTAAIWLVGLLICMIVGIPLFYVAGISIEKLFKSRGII